MKIRMDALRFYYLFEIDTQSTKIFCLIGWLAERQRQGMVKGD